MTTKEKSMHDMNREAYLCERKMKHMHRGIAAGLLVVIGIIATKIFKARK